MSGFWRTQKNYMSSVDVNDRDCNCNVVVTAQPHCTEGHPNALDLGDTMEETTILSVQDSSKKARSLAGARRLRWMSSHCHQHHFQGWATHQGSSILGRWNELVVTEQPHCTEGHSNALDLGDTMEETMILPVQDSLKSKIFGRCSLPQVDEHCHHHHCKVWATHQGGSILGR